MPTHGFSIKPLKVELLAGEQKAIECVFDLKSVVNGSPAQRGCTRLDVTCAIMELVRPRFYLVGVCMEGFGRRVCLEDVLDWFW